MKTKSLLPVFAAVAVLGSYQAQAVQGTALAKMKVVSAIQVTKVSDLLFAEAGPNSPAETVPADAVETPQNASFAVTGEANRPVTVTLPTDGTVAMLNAAGSGPDATINVHSFNSNTPTQIDPSGAMELFVGATRDALTAAQVPGDYEGAFVVDVAYQ